MIQRFAKEYKESITLVYFCGNLLLIIVVFVVGTIYFWSKGPGEALTEGSGIPKHLYFIVPLRYTRSTILTCKEYNLGTFTIFIIQSQVGAIPVFSRRLPRRAAILYLLSFQVWFNPSL